MGNEYQIRAKNIHKNALFIDACGASVIDERYAERMVNAGLTAQCVTIGSNENYREAGEILAKWNRKLKRLSQYFVPVLDASSVKKAKAAGKVGVIYFLQNIGPIEDEIGFVDLLHKMGVRVIQLTYNERNLAADGCQEPQNAGLSDFGVRLIKEMNEVGILLDLSHVGNQSTIEAIEVSTKPMVISHSNCRSLCDTPRNVTDQVIKNLAKKGGVIGINAYPGCVSKKADKTIEDYLAHIDYVVQLVGIDHVGIGLDLIDGHVKEDYTLETGEIGHGAPYKPDVYPPWPWIYPEGIQIVDDLPNITAGLVKRGYKENIKGLWGRT
jgi:membrane dipeptidase